MDENKRMFIEKSYSVKKRFIQMYKLANAGHIGSSLSCADILVFLKFFWMKNNDRLLLSKGHAAAALYSLLAEDKFISEKDIATFCKDGTCFGAHPPINQIKEIPFATGSLGHGLPLCAGMAFASRLKKEERSFFCITSDGELNEGSTWEAALFIAHHKLNNVIWLIDRNKLQGFGQTEEVLRLEPLDKKLESFGFFVTTTDGHNFDSLQETKNKISNSHPNVLICNTVKGHGISFMENKMEWHYLPMNDEQYAKALEEISACALSLPKQ